MNKIWTRLKNRKVMTAVISGLLMILVNVGVIDLTMSDSLMEIANIVLSVGVSVGIFANPDSHVQEDPQE